MDEQIMTKESQWLESSTRSKSEEVDAQRSIEAPENGVPIVAYFHNKRRQFSRNADLIEWISEEERRI
jgi:hypothetical protein